MFGIVVHKHVLRDTGHASFLQTQKLCGDGDLESAHIPRIAGIFQAILVTLEEEFELKPEMRIFVCQE